MPLKIYWWISRIWRRSLLTQKRQCIFSTYLVYLSDAIKDSFSSSEYNTHDEVVSALLTDAIEQKMLYYSIPSTSKTTFIMIRDQSQPKYTNNSRRLRLKRQRSRSHEWRRVLFIPQSFDKKNVICWGCGKKGHIMKIFRITSTNFSSMTNVAEYFDNKANNLYINDIWCQRYALCSSAKVVGDVWIVDSACSNHICYIRKFFFNFSVSNGLNLK